MKLRILVFIIPLFGCTAKLVVKPGGPTSSQYAPVNEAIRPGIVSYRNDGVASIKNLRRNAAYKKMYDACGGKYKILNENVSAFGKEYSNHSEHIYIYFECVQ